MKKTVTHKVLALAGLGCLLPSLLQATLREIPVPNGNMEVMFVADEVTNEFTVPYSIAVNGLIGVYPDGVGKDDWGGGQDVSVPGWTAVDAAYKFSPMSRLNLVNDFPVATNGHTVIAVNPPGWGASQIMEPVAEGLYTLAWGTGWGNGSSAAYQEVPNTIVTLQYSTDGGTTWINLEDAASSVVSNEAELDAILQKGDWSNSYYVAFEIASGSAAIGADLRVYVLADTPVGFDAAMVDNFRLYHSDAGEIAADLDVENGNFGVMFTADEITTEFTVPYNLSVNGLTGVFTAGIGKDDWGGGQDVFVPGWIGVDAAYKFSPMSRVNLVDDFPVESNGHSVVAVNPPGFAQTMVHDTVEATTYYLYWGTGWGNGASAAYQEVPNTILSLQYSTDGGTTWMELEDAAASVTSNEADLDAAMVKGEWSNDYYKAYEIAGDSPAIGADLQVYVLADTPVGFDAAIVDRIRVAKVMGEGGSGEYGPGIFSDYMLVNGSVDTDSWMGWVDVTPYPYIWLYGLNNWAYAADSADPTNGAWLYIYK